MPCGSAIWVTSRSMLPRSSRRQRAIPPADVAHAARMVAQATFECSVDSGVRCHASTQDYLDVIATVRPTLTPEMLQAFDEDIEHYART